MHESINIVVHQKAVTLYISHPDALFDMHNSQHEHTHWSLYKIPGIQNRGDPHRDLSYT